ncbi:MAG: hypothetical protein QOJ23_4702, partial [Actinomycetota bacterium]|nr:hypothetical protein [Actinomycetota bacterium]
VEALESRSAERAADLVEAYTNRAVSLILAAPQAKKIRISDPRYSHLLTDLLNTKLNSAAR